MLKQYSLYLSWRRGFQPRCPLNILAYNLTIILNHCFRYLEFWSIGGLEIQTRVSCDGVMDGGHYFQSIELDM